MNNFTGNISITVHSQDNGQYVCQISSSLEDGFKDNIHFYGQTKEHAIANALDRNQN